MSEDPERIAQLERSLGFYVPVGDHLNECPRCGGVSVLTHEPRPEVRACVCAPCAVEILGVENDPDYVAKLWECCQTRDPRPRFCMSGCTHMNKRGEASRRFSSSPVPKENTDA